MLQLSGCADTHDIAANMEPDKLVSWSKSQCEKYAEKIKHESKKVHQALKYLKDVVDKNILQMLPGSATIVLETIMEVNQLLLSYSFSQESPILMSTYNQLYRSLANLIQWADDILLHGDKALDKEKANEIINKVSDGVKDLIQTSIENLQNRNTSSNHDNKIASQQTSVSASQSSSPDSLRQSSNTKNSVCMKERPNSEEADFNTYDNMLSQSAIMDGNNVMPDNAPPKPPLPLHMLKGGLMSGNQVNAPPLPMKQRGTISPCSHSPLPSPNLPQTASPLSVENTFFGPSLTCSPFSSTPLSKSPSSSISSGLSGSSEDILSERSFSDRSDMTNSPSVTFSNTSQLFPRFSTYDNVSFFKSECQQSHNSNFNEIAQRMQSLAAGTNSLLPNLLQMPPPLPSKLLSKTRTFSHYDNVPFGHNIGMNVSSVHHQHHQTFVKTKSFVQTVRETQSSGEVSQKTAVLSSSSAMAQSGSMSVSMKSSGMYKEASASISLSKSESASMTGPDSDAAGDALSNPPPLPPKKKFIHEYMQMFGQYSGPSLGDLFRHSVASINYYDSLWQQHQKELIQPFFPLPNTPRKVSSLNADVFSIHSNSSDEPPPPSLPPKRNQSISSASTSSRTSFNEIAAPVNNVHVSPLIPSENKVGTNDSEVKQLSPQKSVRLRPAITQNAESDKDSDVNDHSMLDETDVSDKLIFKQENEDGPDIRGGAIDALIVHATTVGRNDFIYQEAFLTTYRTFIKSMELIKKLLKRYHRFSRSGDKKKKKLSRNTFSLIVRVADELCLEVDENMIQTLMDLVVQLLCDGELMLAKILRIKVLEKCEVHRRLLEASQENKLLSSHHLTAKTMYLLDFKSQHVAEQMTLLDAELFSKIEIPEVLLWSKEQSEEHSPNLTAFTEHFNKMSFWCRTQILEKEDPKVREHYFTKFIKIMKCLRRMNNFNSYLAVLSALDSAPIRRLEWQKPNVETLKDMCHLIDSSSSFRTYRQALAETQPPCIPYIGLVLQDLTFVHIGNPDLFPDGNINFAKRWQQFHILDSMRRFKKCHFNFKQHPKILAFTNNFDHYICEESLWQISESIKPRGGKKKSE